MLRSPEGKTGEFKEASVGNWFTYQDTKDAWALSHGFTHEVDVLDGVRYAKVLKTVAHICVDEDADGKPVIEHWKIKSHTEYEK